MKNQLGSGQKKNTANYIKGLIAVTTGRTKSLPLYIQQQRRSVYFVGVKRQKKDGLNSANVQTVRKISGIVLLSHSQIYSTIAAGALNYRVREGNVCFCSAMDTGK